MTGPGRKQQPLGLPLADPGSVRTAIVSCVSLSAQKLSLSEN